MTLGTCSPSFPTLAARPWPQCHTSGLRATRGPARRHSWVAQGSRLQHSRASAHRSCSVAFTGGLLGCGGRKLGGVTGGEGDE